MENMYLLLSRLKLLELATSTFGDLDSNGHDICREAFKFDVRIGNDTFASTFSILPSLSFSLEVG